MKHLVLPFAAVLMLLSAPAPAPAMDGPLFGCDARAPNICRFRIFYAVGGDRIVVLLPGMRQKVPGVTAGSDSYCVLINRNPGWTCTRKLVNGSYNS
jgi:hypothetical protein